MNLMNRSLTQKYRDLLQDILSLKDIKEIQTRIVPFANILIGRIEAFDQEVTALKNEQGGNKQGGAEPDILRTLRDLMVERNTLSQVVRIFASHGEIDPVKETEQEEAHG